MYCDLYLHGVIAPEHYDALVEHLQDDMIEQDIGHFEFQTGGSAFPYESLLASLGLSWVWCAQPGGHKQVGHAILFDATTGERYRADVLDDEMILPAPCLHDPAIVAHMLRWDAFWNDAQLTIATTAHDLMDAQRRVHERRMAGAAPLPWANGA